MKKNKRYSAYMKQQQEFPATAVLNKPEEAQPQEANNNIREFSMFLSSKGEKAPASAVTANETAPLTFQESSSEERLQEALAYLQMELSETLQMMDHKRELEELAEKIESLRNELSQRDKDVLVCENAKLKLKVKEKSYEVAELKDQLKRLQTRNQGMFKRLFRRSEPSSQ